jgi:hypothetical protein
MTPAAPRGGPLPDQANSNNNIFYVIITCMTGVISATGAAHGKSGTGTVPGLGREQHPSLEARIKGAALDKVVRPLTMMSKIWHGVLHTRGSSLPS